MARFGPRLFAQGLVGSSSACSRLYCLLLPPPVHFQTSPPLPTRCSLASASPPLAAPPFSSLTPTSLPRIRPFRIYLPLTETPLSPTTPFSPRASFAQMGVSQ